MLRNKVWTTLLLAFLLIPGFAYGQLGTPQDDIGGKSQLDMGRSVASSPRQSGDDANTGIPSWHIILSPELIMGLASKDWQINKAQLVEDMKDLNPDLDDLDIMPIEDKINLLFSRTTDKAREKLNIETDPKVFTTDTPTGNRKPIDEFDMNAWLQTEIQSQVAKVTSIFRDEQTFWKISAYPQTSVPLKADKKDTAPATAPQEGGWFQRLVNNSALLSNFRKGGTIMYFILLCSVGGLYIVIERLYELRRKNLMPTDFLEGVLLKLPDKTITHNEQENILQDLIKFCEEHDKPIARTLKAGLFVFNQGILGIKSAVISANHHEAAVLGKGLDILSVLANISPLLGLLGTVTGMIKAFEMISMGGIGRPELVAVGISEALITTAGGLFVGIPLLVCFHFLEGKIESVMMDVEEFSLDAVERLIRAKEDRTENSAPAKKEN